MNFFTRTLPVGFFTSWDFEFFKIILNVNFFLTFFSKRIFEVFQKFFLNFFGDFLVCSFLVCSFLVTVTQLWALMIVYIYGVVEMTGLARTMSCGGFLVKLTLGNASIVTETSRVAATVIPWRDGEIKLSYLPDLTPKSSATGRVWQIVWRILPKKRRNFAKKTKNEIDQKTKFCQKQKKIDQKTKFCQ